MIKLSVSDSKHNASHRGRLDIIADILEASNGGTKKTYLLYRCNLSFRQLTYYLDFLVKRGLLHTSDPNVSAHQNSFDITDKGKQFLKAYKGLKSLMQ